MILYLLCLSTTANVSSIYAGFTQHLLSHVKR